MRLGFVAVCSVLLLSACVSKSEPKLQTIRLIHINDTHSYFDASPATLQQTDAGTLYTYIGGHPRLMTKAIQLKQQAVADKIPALFLHGGDAFKGTAYFELFEQHINVDMLNRMPIDAMALGNHEFDIGLEKLADFVERVKFPVLAANVDVSDEPILKLSKNLKPYALFVLRNNKFSAIDSFAQAKGRDTVAVFGLALEDMRAIAPATGALVFAKEVAAAQRTVDELTALGVKHIIALTHLGHQRDLALAAAVNGIDAVVGGHSHSLLGDFQHWGLGKQQPYGEMIHNPNGVSKTCVVQAGQYAQAIGVATLTFSPDGVITNCDGQNTLLASSDFYTAASRDDASRFPANLQQQTERFIENLPRTDIVTEDAEMRAALDTHYKPAVRAAYGKQLTVLDRNIDHVRLPGTAGSDAHGSELAGHIADAMRYWLNLPAQVAKTGRQVDVALIGAGNIRASLQSGSVFEGNIRLEVLPFNTPLSVLTVNGSTLKQLLTQTIAATLVPGAHAGKFPYSANLRYSADIGPDGQLRFSQLQVLQQGQWQNLKPEQQYVLATTQYLADGNDGWQALQLAQQEQTDRVDVIIRAGQSEVFAVQQVLARQDAQGATSFNTRYKTVTTLPCKEAGVDCKVAAQAVIDYLQAKPQLFGQPRPATVTLTR